MAADLLSEALATKRPLVLRAVVRCCEGGMVAVSGLSDVGDGCSLGTGGEVNARNGTLGKCRPIQVGI